MSTVHGRTAPAAVKVQTPSTTSAAAAPTEFFLEIARGKTAHPVRPINRDRFLIGAADWCDLCLGGPQTPILHSVIHLDGQQAWIDAVGEGLELRVNGRVTSFAELHAGDRIEIGSIALTFGQRSAPAKKTVAVTPTPESYYDPVPSDLRDDELDLSSLSAAELVDLIEDDMELVEEFERRKRRGTEALLDAVRRHRPEETATRQGAPIPAPLVGVERLAVLFNDLEATIESIGTLAKDLEARAKHLSPAEVSAAAASLLQFQEQVVTRLDEVLAKVSKHNQAQARRPQRRDAA